MGAVCCCLMDDYEELTNQNSSVYRNCICLRCFVQYFLNVYATLFHRREQYALPSSPQETASLDNSLAEMYRPPPRPLPYDADPRIFHSQRDGLVSRKEKASSHLNDDMEPLTTSDADEESESLSNKNKWNEFPYEGPKEYSSKLSQKFSMDKTAGFAHIYASFKDEDVCPTCLEEYTTENPKIITKCSHHFHLGCIYEWMERSDNCPVCGKEMEFDET